MITQKPESELVAIGAGLRTAYLVQQAGYTLGVAAEDEEAIEAIIEDPQFLEDVSAERATVAAAIKDRGLMEQEAIQLTADQNGLLRRAKVWRRKVVKRARRAERRGHDVPDVLLSVGRANSVPTVTAQMTIILASFEAHLPTLGGPELLAEGTTLLTDLSRVDAEQEVARLATLSAKVRALYISKAKLYLGLKIINDAGQELHADTPDRASQYNLKILHRRPPAPVKAEGKSVNGGNAS